MTCDRCSCCPDFVLPAQGPGSTWEIALPIPNNRRVTKALDDFANLGLLVTVVRVEPCEW